MRYRNLTEASAHRRVEAERLLAKAKEYESKASALRAQARSLLLREFFNRPRATRNGQRETAKKTG